MTDSTDDVDWGDDWYDDDWDDNDWDALENYYLCIQKTPSCHIVCKFCGKHSLHWKEVDGKWRLYDKNDVLHDCRNQSLIEKTIKTKPEAKPEAKKETMELDLLVAMLKRAIIAHEVESETRGRIVYTEVKIDHGHAVETVFLFHNGMLASVVWG